jgi:hypothetical protein
MEVPEATGSAARSAPVWRFLFQPRWLGWHATMVISFWGMLWMGDWQFHRAMSGNGLSWAYTFEWPLFAVFAVVFWAKTLRDELRIRSGKIPDPKLAQAAAEAAAAGIVESPVPQELGIAQARGDEPEDEELAKYNAYLARLNAEVKGHGKWHGLR